MIAAGFLQLLQGNFENMCRTSQLTLAIDTSFYALITLLDQVATKLE